jgi:hypothetical protein
MSEQGWKLVPVEPTPQMRKASADAWLDCGDRLFLNKAAAALRAGIAAAPQPQPAQASAQVLEALRKDAERYRWLRDNPWPPELEADIMLHRNARWDAEIDAAIAAAEAAQAGHNVRANLTKGAAHD